MTQHAQNELRINARKLNLIDLDFPECVASLKREIDARISTSVALVELDVRWCVVIYSQAYIFLDSCLSNLVSNSVNFKKLIILTTDNYLTRELTCYELFRTTLAANTNDHDPKSVTSSVDQYCTNHNLSIEVQIFSGDTEDLDTPKLNSYNFPEGTHE